MMERLLDRSHSDIYTFSSFSLSQFFLISRIIIEILAIELDLIIMNFTKGQEFYREISRQTKQNRSTRNCLAWNKRVVAQVKNTRRGEGLEKLARFQFVAPILELPSVCTFV